MNHGIDPESEKKILAILSALMPNVTIYLFGSRARGTHSPRSDIDIALKGTTLLSRHAIAELVRMLQASDIPYKIEIVDFNRVSDDMRASILKEGIIWQV
jgi:uncharacterized protein